MCCLRTVAVPLLSECEIICNCCKVSEDALEALIETSEGDLRRAITTLQSAARLKSPDKPEVGKNDVCEVAGVVPEKWVNGIIDVCSKSSFPETQDFVDKLIAEGFSGSQLISQLHDKVSQLWRRLFLK